MKINKIVKEIQIREDIPNLIRCMNNPVICEIGVQMGLNFKNMITENTIKAVAIDSWTNTGTIGQNDSNYSSIELDNQYNTVVDMFKDDNRVSIIRNYSLESSKLFDNETFDFIYIDADHTYDAVLSDLEHWYPKLKIGGVISGHDYIDGDYTVSIGHLVRFGVMDAVSEFLKKYRIDEDNFHISTEQYASFFITKIN